MTKTCNVASFVLRFTQDLWQDAQGEPHIRWRGHIRHIQGDEEDRFTDVADAIVFMHRYLTQLTVDTLSGRENMTQERIFLESFNLWGRFASSYIDIIFQTVQQGFKQSEALTQRLNEMREQGLSAWRWPGQPEQDQILEVLGDLQEQVQGLSNRIKILEETLQQDVGKS